MTYLLVYAILVYSILGNLVAPEYVHNPRVCRFYSTNESNGTVGVISASPDIDIFWLNLASSKERKRFMNKQLKFYGWHDHTRVSAFTSRQIYVPKQLQDVWECERLDNMTLEEQLRKAPPAKSIKFILK